MAILKMSRDEYEKKYGEKPNTFTNIQNAQPKSFGQKLGDFGRGLGNILGGTQVGEFIGSKIASQTPQAKQLQQDPMIQQQMAKTGSKLFQEPTGTQLAGDALKIGSTIASAALPVAGTFLARVGAGAAIGYGADVSSKLTQNKPVSQSLTPGVGTAVGAALPGVGAGANYAKNVMGRLFKGVGSKLSGVSSETIEKIIQNPETAKRATKILEKNGNNKLLESNAKVIVNGVSQVKKEARARFGKELEGLSKTDIDPGAFKGQLQYFLDKYGSVKNGRRLLKNVEFENPKLHQKASELIDKVTKSNLDLNGKSLWKLIDDVDSSKFKTTATDAERLSFNSFIDDLSSGLKNALHMSTDKFKPMNQAFSQDMQLAEAVEDIFGNVNYKNLPELVKASQKLEGVFAQKGLAPQVVDDFLNRIGVSPGQFKTSEAVRQIANKHMSANPVGLTIGEISQAVTSSVFTPNLVKTIATQTGMAQQKIIPILKDMTPLARKIFLQSLSETRNRSDQEFSPEANQ